MVNYSDQLTELFREQIKTGFVLSDPAGQVMESRKIFFDMDSCVPFSVLWNPDRAVRNRRNELIERGIIAPGVDESLLINKDAAGDGCFLCPENIKLQNPKEELFELKLAGEKYLAGANFAPITENHFTVMSAKHRPQPSGKDIIPALIDATELTNGGFRAVFNGLAGASIMGHEHFHITTSHFPVEDTRIEYTDIIKEGGGVRVSRPGYCLPLRIVEGINRTGTEQAAMAEIDKWHLLDEKNHTENIIAAKEGPIYRLHIFLRDRRKIKSFIKQGAIAAFECGGIIVMSGSDRKLYENIDLKTVRLILESIAPED